MLNKIIYIESTLWKTIVITKDEMWLSGNNITSILEFEKGLQKTGILKSSYAYDLSTVSEISFNEADKEVKIKYLNEKGKQKKLTAGFKDEAFSNEFGNFLGEHLGLNKYEKQESQIKPLLLNMVYILISVGLTYFLGTMDDTNELTESGSRRSRNKGAFLKLIVDTIGQTGILLIGSLISLYLMYQLYQRFQNPANEVVFQK